MFSKIAALFFASILSFSVMAEEDLILPVDEFVFIKAISGQNKSYVEEQLGKPFSKEKRENQGGEVEFWVYKNIVKIAGTEKVYKFTQVGIVNDAVETVGNSNLQP
ncbi:hypothetical protein Q7C_2129 [Methylophaga frappieri]|uniref:Lipoprotein SmpA/OmlA domain-containing protein n=1 Tax=Methylophaga frappieri (strain ATCC BAA-2434 / DSM 25690 / JAM7) TaxID=754477 RepID=I1YK22_METFJ|nr:hypothetical protein [Methylophaga frappieri]AFJ03265.1 hypothetical protein Q7C_2129 [Methylophaga frappieri]